MRGVAVASRPALDEAQLDAGELDDLHLKSLELTLKSIRAAGRPEEEAQAVAALAERVRAATPKPSDLHTYTYSEGRAQGALAAIRLALPADGRACVIALFAGSPDRLEALRFTGGAALQPPWPDNGPCAAGQTSDRQPHAK